MFSLSLYFIRLIILKLNFFHLFVVVKDLSARASFPSLVCAGWMRVYMNSHQDVGYLSEKLLGQLLYMLSSFFKTKVYVILYNSCTYGKSNKLSFGISFL
ncbi:hypothetical protein HPP92_028097 [Vanilla planifolia]|uniref:Uncharacterized protein n=1 Tax=Vanilla planifolia TaxID=51239 RepID=A0A835P8N8_VANPL|nr:hypothetical protein HPP92_028097 [Vanilla planifolia]